MVCVCMSAHPFTRYQSPFCETLFLTGLEFSMLARLSGQQALVIVSLFPSTRKIINTCYHPQLSLVCSGNIIQVLVLLKNVIY